MKNKYGFYINGNYGGMAYEEAFRDIAQIGYSAVEIAHAPAKETATDLSRYAMAAKECGIFISEVGLQRDYVTLDKAEHDAYVQDTICGIRNCAEAGINVVNLYTGPRPWIASPLRVGKDISVMDAWGLVYDAFDSIVPVAEECGVDIAVENVWGHMCHDFFTMQHLVNKYGSPRLGVNFDPSHDVLSGNTDMRFLINGWGTKHIKHMHLKDAAGIMESGKFIFPLLGEGLVDWAGFRQGIDDIGYDGVLSVEFESAALRRYMKNDLSIAARLCMQAIKDLLET